MTYAPEKNNSHKLRVYTSIASKYVVISLSSFIMEEKYFWSK